MAKTGTEGTSFANVEDTGGRREETVDTWFARRVGYGME